MRLLHLRGDKLSTGFVGTRLLGRGLAQGGEDKMAYHLLHNEDIRAGFMKSTLVQRRFGALEQS